MSRSAPQRPAGSSASEAISSATSPARLGSVTAFFPCYNDAATIAGLVVLADRVLQELANDYEIIVVDDGSTDGSRAVLRELGGLYGGKLRVVLHERNRGYGGALRSGFAHAAKEWIFYTDGDGQYDVAELPRLAALAGPGIDVVQGYKLGRSDPWYRVVIGAVYRDTMKWLFSLTIRDVDCDFRMLRRTALERIRLQHDSGVICLELVRKLQDAGARVVEVGVSHHFRMHGRSQFFNFRRVARVAVDIVGLWWRLVVLRGRGCAAPPP